MITIEPIRVEAAREKTVGYSRQFPTFPGDGIR